MVLFEGQLQTRKWQDQSGADRYSTEVVLQGFGGTLVMLDGKQDGQTGYAGNDTGRGNQGDAGGAYAGGVDDDAIPFAPIF